MEGGEVRLQSKRLENRANHQTKFGTACTRTHFSVNPVEVRYSKYDRLSPHSDTRRKIWGIQIRIR